MGQTIDYPDRLVPEVPDGVAGQAELLPLLGPEAGHHLVEDVVVLLGGQRSDHSALVEEVAVDLRSVESSVAHLHLDEVALRSGFSVFQ